MNKTAEQHLTRAKKYLAIAESKDAKREAYKAAAEEIAAYKQESGDTWDALASALGRGAKSLRDIDRWRRSGFKAETPFLMDTKATGRAAASHTKKLLATAPLEQVEQIISTLPKERQQAVAAAAGHAYHKARQDYNEAEKKLTPADKKAREATNATIDNNIAKALAPIAQLMVVGLLEQATEEMKLMNSEQVITSEMLQQIKTALNEFVNEYHVAQAMAGLDIDLAILSVQE